MMHGQKNIKIVHTQLQTPINIQLLFTCHEFCPCGFFIVFDISNLTHCPIHHSGYLQFNVALLLRYSKSQFK